MYRGEIPTAQLKYILKYCELYFWSLYILADGWILLILSVMLAYSSRLASLMDICNINAF